MTPFEMLYGHRCQTSLFWSEAGERKVFGPDILQQPRSKFVWLGRTYELHNRGKRAMPIIGEESWALKWEILCTSRCRIWEVCAILRSKASSHRGSLDHSRCIPCISVEEMSMEDLDAKEDLSYQEYPVKILETLERVTRNKKIRICKVQ
jgi:hypothetical protein